MMHRLLFILLAVYLFSCGQDTSTENVSENPIETDSTATERDKEFKAINEMIKADINNTAWYLKRANLYVKYDEIDLAVKDVDRAISIDSLVPDFYLLKAELLKKQDKFKQAKIVLDQCMMIDNNNVEARVELGYLALVAKDYKQAMEYADAALKRNVHYAEAYYLKGMIFQEKRDTVLALSSYNTAVEQENDYYEAYIALGILNMNRDLKLAKGYLQNAIRIQPESLEALYAYGMACQNNGDYNEAIETYHKILSISEYREPYFNLGYIHQEYLKVYDVAIEWYTKAIELEPKYVDAYYNRGLCYEQLDKKKEAIADFKLALQLNPQYTNAALALDRVLKQ